MKRPLKASALFVTLTFLTQSIFPVPVFAGQNFPLEVKAAPAFQLNLPPELGTIESLHSGTGPVLIHIQTAHGNYEAQKKIQAILHHLKNNYGIKTLLVEGSALQLRPEILRLFPQEMDLTMEIADDLTKKAWVKGSELFLLEAREAEAYGIENLKAYRENIDAFRAVLNQRNKTAGFLAGMNLQIERLTSPYLNKDLRAFLKRIEFFDAGSAPILDRLSYLKSQARKHLEIDLSDAAHQIDWPMLVRIFKLSEFESKIQMAGYAKERAEFLKAVRPFLDRAPGETYSQIERLLSSPLSRHQLPDPETELLFEAVVKALPRNFNYGQYPNVKIFIGRLLLQSELRPGLLMKEMEKLADKIAGRLAVTPEEKKILALLKSCGLLKKLYALELTPADYETIQKKNNEIEPGNLIQSFLELNRAKRVRGVKFEHVEEIQALFDKAVEFYRLVKERDRWMTENVIQHFKENKADKAVVITGGFHAEPFKEFFESQNYNYALISPKINTTDGREAYLRSILQTQSKPLDAGTVEVTYPFELPPGSVKDHRMERLGPAIADLLMSVQTGSKRLGKEIAVGALEGKLKPTVLAQELGGIRIIEGRGAAEVTLGIGEQFLISAFSRQLPGDSAQTYKTFLSANDLKLNKLPLSFPRSEARSAKFINRENSTLNEQVEEMLAQIEERGVNLTSLGEVFGVKRSVGVGINPSRASNLSRGFYKGLLKALITALKITPPTTEADLYRTLAAAMERAGLHRDDILPLFVAAAWISPQDAVAQRKVGDLTNGKSVEGLIAFPKVYTHELSLILAGSFEYPEFELDEWKRKVYGHLRIMLDPESAQEIKFSALQELASYRNFAIQVINEELLPDEELQLTATQKYILTAALNSLGPEGQVERRLKYDRSSLLHRFYLAVGTLEGSNVLPPVYTQAIATILQMNENGLLDTDKRERGIRALADFAARPSNSNIPTRILEQAKKAAALLSGNVPRSEARNKPLEERKGISKLGELTFLGSFGGGLKDVKMFLSVLRPERKHEITGVAFPGDKNELTVKLAELPWFSVEAGQFDRDFPIILEKIHRRVGNGVGYELQMGSYAAVAGENFQRGTMLIVIPRPRSEGQGVLAWIKPDPKTGRARARLTAKEPSPPRPAASKPAEDEAVRAATVDAGASSRSEARVDLDINMFPPILQETLLQIIAISKQLRAGTEAGDLFTLQSAASSLTSHLFPTSPPVREPLIQKFIRQFIEFASQPERRLNKRIVVDKRIIERIIEGERIMEGLHQIYSELDRALLTAHAFADLHHDNLAIKPYRIINSAGRSEARVGGQLALASRRDTRLVTSDRPLVRSGTAIRKTSFMDRTSPSITANLPLTSLISSTSEPTPSATPPILFSSRSTKAPTSVMSNAAPFDLGEATVTRKPPAVNIFNEYYIPLYSIFSGPRSEVREHYKTNSQLVKAVNQLLTQGMPAGQTVRVVVRYRKGSQYKEIVTLWYQDGKRLDEPYVGNVGQKVLDFIQGQNRSGNGSGYPRKTEYELSRTTNNRKTDIWVDIIIERPAESRSEARTRAAASFPEIKLRLIKEGTRDVAVSIPKKQIVVGEIPINVQDPGTLSEFNRFLNLVGISPYYPKDHKETPALVLVTFLETTEQKFIGINTGKGELIDFLDTPWSAAWLGGGTVLQKVIPFSVGLTFDPEDESIAIRPPSPEEPFRSDVRAFEDNRNLSLRQRILGLFLKEDQKAVRVLERFAQRKGPAALEGALEKSGPLLFQDLNPGDLIVAFPNEKARPSHQVIQAGRIESAFGNPTNENGSGRLETMQEATWFTIQGRPVSEISNREYRIYRIARAFEFQLLQIANDLRNSIWNGDLEGIQNILKKLAGRSLLTQLMELTEPLKQFIRYSKELSARMQRGEGEEDLRILRQVYWELYKSLGGINGFSLDADSWGALFHIRLGLQRSELRSAIETEEEKAEAVKAETIRRFRESKLLVTPASLHFGPFQPQEFEVFSRASQRQDFLVELPNRTAADVFSAIQALKFQNNNAVIVVGNVTQDARANPLPDTTPNVVLIPDESLGRGTSARSKVAELRKKSLVIATVNELNLMRILKAYALDADGFLIRWKGALADPEILKNFVRQIRKEIESPVLIGVDLGLAQDDINARIREALRLPEVDFIRFVVPQPNAAGLLMQAAAIRDRLRPRSELRASKKEKEVLDSTHYLLNSLGGSEGLRRALELKPFFLDNLGKKWERLRDGSNLKAAVSLILSSIKSQFAEGKMEISFTDIIPDVLKSGGDIVELFIQFHILVRAVFPGGESLVSIFSPEDLVRSLIELERRNTDFSLSKLLGSAPASGQTIARVPFSSPFIYPDFEINLTEPLLPSSNPTPEDFARSLVDTLIAKAIENQGPLDRMEAVESILRIEFAPARSEVRNGFAVTRVSEMSDNKAIDFDFGSPSGKEYRAQLMKGQGKRWFLFVIPKEGLGRSGKGEYRLKENREDRPNLVAILTALVHHPVTRQSMKPQLDYWESFLQILPGDLLKLVQETPLIELLPEKRQQYLEAIVQNVLDEWTEEQIQMLAAGKTGEQTQRVSAYGGNLHLSSNERKGILNSIKSRFLSSRFVLDRPLEKIMIVEKTEWWRNYYKMIFKTVKESAELFFVDDSQGLFESPNLQKADLIIADSGGIGEDAEAFVGEIREKESKASVIIYGENFTLHQIRKLQEFENVALLGKDYDHDGALPHFLRDLFSRSEVRAIKPGGRGIPSTLGRLPSTSAVSAAAPRYEVRLGESLKAESRDLVLRPEELLIIRRFRDGLVPFFIFETLKRTGVAELVEVVSQVLGRPAFAEALERFSQEDSLAEIFRPGTVPVFDFDQLARAHRRASDIPTDANETKGILLLKPDALEELAGNARASFLFLQGALLLKTGKNPFIVSVVEKGRAERIRTQLEKAVTSEKATEGRDLALIPELLGALRNNLAVRFIEIEKGQTAAAIERMLIEENRGGVVEWRAETSSEAVDVDLSPIPRFAFKDKTSSTRKPGPNGSIALVLAAFRTQQLADRIRELGRESLLKSDLLHSEVSRFMQTSLPGFEFGQKGFIVPRSLAKFMNDQRIAEFVGSRA